MNGSILKRQQWQLRDLTSRKNLRTDEPECKSVSHAVGTKLKTRKDRRIKFGVGLTRILHNINVKVKVFQLASFWVIRHWSRLFDRPSYVGMYVCILHLLCTNMSRKWDGKSFTCVNRKPKYKNIRFKITTVAWIYTKLFNKVQRSCSSIIKVQYQ